MVSLPL
jgi:hypothetical protein